MLFKNLMAWLIVAMPHVLLSQSIASFKGAVMETETENPIVGATVSVDEHYVASDIDGFFTIQNLKPGKHKIRITSVGYATIETFITIPTEEMVVFQMETSTTALETVQISGKTRQRKMKENPLSTVTASQLYMEANRENSLMQTLANIPGVTTLNIGSGQSKPVIRGLGFNRVSVIQNGIKHEAQQWGNDHGLEIDQYGLGEINIIKGPASLMYGSDAIAGVVDIQAPKAPKMHSFGGEVNLLGESNNDLLAISTGLYGRKESWFFRTRLTFRDYADYKVPTDRINYDSYIFNLKNHRLRNTAGTEANASFQLGYIGNTFKNDTYFSNSYSKNGFFANAHGLEVRTSKIDYDRSNRDIDLPYHLVNHFKLINTSTVYLNGHDLEIEWGFQHNHREELSEPVPHGYMPTPPDSKERIFEKNTLSANLRDSFKIHENHEVVIGANGEYQHNTISGWGFLVPAFQRATVGVFAYDHYTLSEKWHMQGGLRYDFGSLHTEAYSDWYPSPQRDENGNSIEAPLQRSVDKTLQFGSFSGSLGISHSGEKFNYKLNMAKGFRMPLAHELASDGVNYHMYRYEQGKMDLKPEESYQWDVDIAYGHGALQWSVSPFASYFENFIYLNPTPHYFESLQIYRYTQNKVFRFGSEASISYSPFNGFSLETQVEYVRSKQLNGPKKHFSLPFSPPLSGKVSARYMVQKDIWNISGIRVNAEMRWSANQNEIVPPEEKTEGYQVFDFSVMGKISLLGTGPLSEFRLKINNLLNTQYYNHTSFYRLIQVPEAGRNISLSLTVPF